MNLFLDSKVDDAGRREELYRGSIFVYSRSFGALQLCEFAKGSIDFRPVHLDDVWSKCGAPNIDSACTGTIMGDYISARDFSHVSGEAIALCFDGPEAKLTSSTASLVNSERAD